MTNGNSNKNKRTQNRRKISVESVYKCMKLKLIDVMYVVVSIVTETLAFLS
jgi:hypothetical protein